MKKLLCFLLASLMLLGTMSCGTGDDTPDETIGQTEAISESVTEDPNYVCDLPSDLDYEGATINIIYADVTGRRDELVSEGVGSGVVSEAVHERNLIVEDTLKVVLNLIPESGTSVSTAVLNDINSGDGAYDLVFNATNASVSPAIKGRYLNLTELDHIDTSKHYWTQGYNDMVTFTDANMQFLASGPIAISMSRYMFLTIYNKELFTDNKVDDLYEVVKSGKWTLDYQYSILKDKYVDKDGNSKYSSGDFYGFVTGNIVSVDPYAVAADVHLVVKDPDTGDLMFNSEDIEALSDLCDKTQLIYNDVGTFIYTGVDKDDVRCNYIIEHFISENAMMATTSFLIMETNFGELSELTYGIAPMPKYSEQQPEYHSYVQDQVTSIGISAVVGDPDRQSMVAAVMESMAYHSYRLVRPAYYETVLSERYMQDPQSYEILDLMFDSLTFDFSSSCSNIFSGCVIRDNLRPLLSGTKNTIVSSATSWESTVNKSLRDQNKMLSMLKPD